MTSCKRVFHASHIQLCSFAGYMAMVFLHYEFHFEICILYFQVTFFFLLHKSKFLSYFDQENVKSLLHHLEKKAHLV